MTSKNVDEYYYRPELIQDDLVQMLNTSKEWITQCEQKKEEEAIAETLVMEYNNWTNAYGIYGLCKNEYMDIILDSQQ